MKKILRFFGFKKCYACGKIIFEKIYWGKVSEDADDLYGFNAPFHRKCIPGEMWEQQFE